jgi:hypothetical protein
VHGREPSSSISRLLNAPAALLVAVVAAIQLGERVVADGRSASVNIGFVNVLALGMDGLSVSGSRMHRRRRRT